MSLPILKELQLCKENYDKTINLVDGLWFRQKDKIRMIEFYTNSRYLTNGAVNLNGSQFDELGREKPFYQILNAMCDVENAAKDIDTKDISVTSDDSNHYTESFLMGKDIYEWMKEVNFGKTLNEMRDTHTRYGSLLVKKVMIDNQLTIQVPEWKNLITDQVNIQDGTIIEVHYMTPSEMLKMNEWNQDKVKEAIKRVKKQGAGYRIPVYEVRGEFPKSYIQSMDSDTDKSDYNDTEFSYQLYYIAGDYSSEYSNQQNANSASFTTKLIPLYWEDDTERVYKYLPRKKRSGRAFGVGVMEEGEEAQVWTNDAILKQSRAMEYSTKFVGQTSSKKLKGRNMLTETDNGTLLEIEDGKPILQVPMMPAGGLGQFDTIINQWYTQFERVTSAYAAQRGDAPPSGTPFRLQATVLQQSNSVFQDLQEEMGIFITELFNDEGWILDNLVKKLNTKHILAHEFSMEELREIDKSFAQDYANKTAMEAVLSGKLVTADDYEQYVQIGSDFIKKTKTSRFLQIPQDYYKKVKASITVNVTGEQTNKAAALESLGNIITLYASNPAIAQDPVLTQLFMKIIELSGAGISPVTLMGSIQEQAKNLQQQQALAQQQQAQQAVQQNPQPPQNPGLTLAANPNPNA